MTINVLTVGLSAVCVFALSAVSSYAVNYRSIYDNGAVADATALDDELRLLNTRIQALEGQEELLPIESNWLTVQKIIAQYPDVAWRAAEDLDIATETEINNGWQAMIIASPDLVLPVMRRIQKAVPAEVLEIQLNQQQGVLLINILGLLQ